MTSIKQRSFLYKQFLCGSIDKAVYTRYRNNLTNLIRIAKIQYYRDYFNKHRKNGAEIWKLKNKTLKNFKANTLCSSVENLNSFFANLGSSTVKHFAHPNSANYLIHVQRNAHSFILQETDWIEVLLTGSPLKTKQSSGYDEVSTQLLKSILHLVLVHLVHIINLSFITGIVSNKLKLAKVVSIF